jgi:hypothetical protein
MTAGMVRVTNLTPGSDNPTCRYHTITTNNFDFQRWARSYSIPPMQGLEDVLKMALSGRDPFEIEAMLRARGDYRPHGGGCVEAAWFQPLNL